MSNERIPAKPPLSNQKLMHLILGLFVLSAMTASGVNEVIKWIKTRSFVEKQASGVKKESAEDLAAAHESKVKACIVSDLAFLKAFEASTPHSPNEASYFVEKACEEKVTSEEQSTYEPKDPKSSWALVRDTKIALGDRAILEEYLRSGPKNLNAKVEREFFPLSKALKDKKTTCEASAKEIESFIQKGSVRALLFGSACARESCKNDNSDSCKLSVGLARRAAEKGDPIGRVYMAIYEINDGNVEKGLSDARELIKSGEVSPLDMIPQLRDDVYSAKIAPTAALITLASDARYGTQNLPLKTCAEAVFFEKWQRDGKILKTDEISDKEWMEYVSDWSNPQSKNYQPELVMRFACEILSDPATKKKIYENKFSDRAIDFCRDIKDTRFASVCGKSV